MALALRGKALEAIKIRAPLATVSVAWFGHKATADGPTCRDFLDTGAAIDGGRKRASTGID